MLVLDLFPRCHERIDLFTDLSFGLATLTNRYDVPEQTLRIVGTIKRFEKRMGWCFRPQSGIDVV